jgi:hypothetical protein
VCPSVERTIIGAEREKNAPLGKIRCSQNTTLNAHIGESFQRMEVEKAPGAGAEVRELDGRLRG